MLATRYMMIFTFLLQAQAWVFFWKAVDMSLDTVIYCSVCLFFLFLFYLVCCVCCLKMCFLEINCVNFFQQSFSIVDCFILFFNRLFIHFINQQNRHSKWRSTFKKRVAQKLQHEFPNRERISYTVCSPLGIVNIWHP